MEGDIDAFERDGCETANEFDRFRFGVGLFGAFFDDFDEMLFDVVEAHGLHELLDVDFFMVSFSLAGNVPSKRSLRCSEMDELTGGNAMQVAVRGLAIG